MVGFTVPFAATTPRRKDFETAAWPSVTVRRIVTVPTKSAAGV